MYPKDLIDTFTARRNRFNLIYEMLEEHANFISSPKGMHAGGGWKHVSSRDLFRVADMGNILTGAAVSVARSWVDTVLHICNQPFLDEPLSESEVSTANTMKHRELIHSRAVLSSTGSAIVVESFEKDGRSWNEWTVTDLVSQCDSLFRHLTSLLFSLPDIAT